MSLSLFASCAPHREGAVAPAGDRPWIGVVAGLTGPLAAYGQADRRGAELAAAERGITLAIEDDQGRPEQSASAVERLIASGHVKAIMCCDTSGETLAVAPIGERESIPLVTPTASAPQVTKGKRFTFRLCATDDFEARSIAKVARVNMHAARAAIIRDTKNDYSVGMAATFTAEFTRAGGTVLGVFDYAEGDSDFRGPLTAIAAVHPDVLLVPGYYGDVAQIASQARDLGLGIPLLGGSGWDSPKLLEIGGAALENSRFVSGVRSGSPRFVAAFRKRYGVDPDAANAQSYDAISIIAEASKKGRDGRAIRDAIAATHDFPGASGPITIGPDGNARKSLAIFRVVNGKFVEEGRVDP